MCKDQIECYRQSQCRYGAAFRILNILRIYATITNLPIISPFGMGVGYPQCEAPQRLMTENSMKWKMILVIQRKLEEDVQSLMGKTF